LQQVARLIGRSLAPAAVERERLQHWLAEASPSSGREVSKAGASSEADGPVVDFVNAALGAAVSSAASDVHFECDRGGVTVKLRKDGVLSRFARMDDAQSAQEVISRIKVLAQLDITERRLPQDGRFRFTLGGHALDMRVSIMPSVFGEDAVLRLLDKAQLRERDAGMSLGRLGFGTEQAELLRELANEPSGMVLVTGPTGSGKTTTVYAALSEINTGLEKIITIEDPVEYELPGVLQIPVNERKGLTFAKGLRSILRHDPDRILVGEIRDGETAEIAVQSALTGHLVFTTVHANSIADVMGRFRHFGLDMFGFMSSLNGVVVQRLIRHLCPHCTGTRALVARERQWLDDMGAGHVDAAPVATGCERCGGSGYRGRFVLAEVHVVDDTLRDHVTENSPVSALKRHALESGVASLGVQAARKIAEGQTTLEEVKRVVGWR
jgi:general secretion pathway protein E